MKLYPDSTFKWTSEYDLSWSEYGKYKLSDQILTLNLINYCQTGTQIKEYLRKCMRKRQGRRMERSIAWFNWYRRLGKDFEANMETSENWA